MRQMILLATLALPLSAQQPQVQNGTVTTDSQTTVQAELTQLEASNGTAWLAYTVPTSTRIEQNSNEITYLEGDHHSSYNTSSDAGTPPYHALILLRVNDHPLTNILP